MTKSANLEAVIFCGAQLPSSHFTGVQLPLETITIVKEKRLNTSTVTTESH